MTFWETLNFALQNLLPFLKLFIYILYADVYLFQITYSIEDAPWYNLVRLSVRNDTVFVITTEVLDREQIPYGEMFFDSNIFMFICLIIYYSINKDFPISSVRKKKVSVWNLYCLPV